MKKNVMRAAKWLAGVGVLVGIIWFNRDGFRDIGQKWHEFEPTYLVIAAVVFLIGTIITFLRWHVLVRAQQLPFRVTDALRLGFIGLFFNAFLPGAITGDVVKAAYLAKEQARRTVAISTIVIDRVIGLYGLLLLASLAGWLYWDDANAVLDENGRAPLRMIVTFTWLATLGATVAVALLALALGASNRLRNWLERLPKVGKVLGMLMKAGVNYKSQPLAVIVATLLAMVGHVGFVLCFYLAARAIPAPVPTLQQHALIVPVGMVVESIPLTPGGLGVSEATYETLYRLVDSDGRFKDKGVFAKFSHRLVNWAVALIGLGFYLPLRGKVRRIMQDQENLPMEASP